MFDSTKHNFEPFDRLIYLATPTSHPKKDGEGYEELDYIKEAFDENWLSTEGRNINECEKLIAEKVGTKYAVALATGTSALHMAVKLAGVQEGDKVACSDLTFSATVNPVLYEKGYPIFIDSEYETWNMDPVALEKAFEIYPDIKCVVLAHLYGTPAKVDEIKAICEKHNVPLIEDAAESLGATYKGEQTGSLGTIGCISCNGNKIITGSSGGFLLTDDLDTYNKVKKWSTQSRENAPWYQHEEVGYNYRMSNIVAGMIRGQIPHLNEHIEQKKQVYEKYREGLKDLPIQMNPLNLKDNKPNYWLSCLLIDEDKMSRQVRGDEEALFIPESGKSSPTEILEVLKQYNVQARPIWKPMHLQPIFRNQPFINRYGSARALTDAYIQHRNRGADNNPLDVSLDIFNRGLCLPSDNSMENKDQDIIIKLIAGCFD